MAIAGWATVVLLLCISGVIATDLSQYQGHFKDWYAGWSTLGPQIIRDNCSELYQIYRTHNQTGYLELIGNGVDSISQSKWIHSLVVCILQNTDELVKVEVSVSSVILGLLPTILILASSSCVELGLLAQCRPILAVLLAAGSPGLNPLRRLDYYGEATYLLTQPRADPHDKDSRHGSDTTEKADSDNPVGHMGASFQPTKRGLWSILISATEYVLVLAAIGNIVHNTWQLSVLTVSAYAPQTAFQPMLWVILALCAHCLEMYCIAIRVRRITDRPAAIDSHIDHNRSAYRSVISWFTHREGQPCAVQERLTLQWRRENKWSRFISWVCNKLIILYITWGTFFFSSILFVKVTDAMVIFLRYLASVIVCRLIIQYELDGMSMKVRIPRWMQG